MENGIEFSHRAIAEYVARLARSVQGDAFVRGLNPAQWAALRFFSQANRFSRTVGAFARYQGTTRGTATQTTKALVQKGYLRKQPNERDRRSFRLELSAKALKVLKHDPLQDLVAAAGALSPEQSYQLLAALTIILERLRAQHGQPQFGICGLSCRYLDEQGVFEERCYECELYGEPIGTDELAALCVNYAPRPESPVTVHG